MLTSQINNMDLSVVDEEDDLLFDDDFSFDQSLMIDSNNIEVDFSSHSTQNEPILLFTQPDQQLKPTQFISWPIYGWRIAAPQSQIQQLDFLQLTSLRLAKAGVIRHQEQANLLGQHKDFIYRVMVSLKDDGYLQANGLLTEAGEQILVENGKISEERITYGWIFQDGTSGELFPYFHSEKLPFASVEKKQITQNFIIPRLKEKPQAPQVTEVIEAIKTQRRLQRNSSETTTDENEEISVRFLTNKPQSFRLLVTCILEETDDGQISLICPFGLPHNLRWERLLNFASSQSDEIKEIVNQLHLLSQESWQKKQPFPLQPLNLTREASDKVKFELGLPPSKIWQNLWEEVEKMERSFILVNRGFDEVDNLITRLNKVLERLILTILEVDPIPADFWEQYRKDDIRHQCLKDTILACGFLEIEQIEPIIQQKIGKIRSVIDGNGESFRAYCATWILAASRRQSLHHHILKKLYQENPDWLIEMEKITNLRNQSGAAHICRNNDISSPILNQDEVKDLVKTIYQLVHLCIKILKSVIPIYSNSQKSTSLFSSNNFLGDDFDF